ncbi:hypothetical protein CP061683_0584A, partial [Chlamydia psittaci 06-1683]
MAEGLEISIPVRLMK